MVGADRETLVRVAVRIREEVSRLDRIAVALGDALREWGPEPQTAVVIHWVGGLLHDLFTGIEKAFREVSPTINGRSPDPDAWHRDLVHAMTLDLPGIRPPVIDTSREAPLVELLKFRHLYRNLYSFDLRWERVRELADVAARLWPDIRSDLGSFAGALDVMAGNDPTRRQ